MTTGNSMLHLQRKCDRNMEMILDGENHVLFGWCQLCLENKLFWSGEGTYWQNIQEEIRGIKPILHS